VAGRWTYDEADVLARVETLRRGDRIYLPGAGPAARGNGGRVVSHLEHYDANEPRDGVPALPARVVVVYFTGERARPLGRELGDAPGELVTAGLRWLEVGTRIKCRRARRVAA
jgi:hypothetical protein